MKFTKKDIKYIINNYKEWGDAVKLAKEFKVNKSTIQNIIQLLREQGINIPKLKYTNSFQSAIDEVIKESKGKQK